MLNIMILCRLGNDHLSESLYVRNKHDWHEKSEGLFQVALHQYMAKLFCQEMWIVLY